MNKRMKHNSWVLAAIAAGFGAAVLAHGAEPTAEPKKVDSALQKAQKQEATTRKEESSREMARSATREIARSERNRAKDALRKWRARGGGAEAIHLPKHQPEPRGGRIAHGSAQKRAGHEVGMRRSA